MKYLVSILSLIIITGCSNQSDPVSADQLQNKFGFYFLQDSTLKENDIADMSLSQLELNPNAWFTSEDIAMYDYSSHCIYLKIDKSDLFDFHPDGLRFDRSLLSKPFVVVAGYTRCYVGSIHSFILSTFPIGPSIDELSVMRYPSDIIKIEEVRLKDKPDVRFHPKIEKALNEIGILHYGIQITLTSFKVIDRRDTSTVEYNYTIRNNDRDDLYVFDPDKMGSGLFHHFTYGPSLWNPPTRKLISPEFKESKAPVPYDSWKMEWLTLIRSGESKSFTVRLKGYPYIKTGNYEVQMGFGSLVRIERGNRIHGSGRIWIGSISSNTLNLKIR